MKKRKLWASLLLAFSLAAGALSPCTLAEEDYYAEEAYEEGGGQTESETEFPESYYAPVQSNEIAGWPQGAPVNAETAIVMDADTGAILYAKDIDKREYPASITKIVTTMVALENGNLEDVVTFSENAVYSIEFGSSHLGLTEGEELTMEQCLYGIMMASANEISNAVAEHIGGSIEEYVKMMNAWVEKLGCQNTHFVNVHGLHDENHYTCALDMALIMQEALKNEKFREIMGTVESYYPETNKVDEKRYFINHHKMISEEGMLYEGCLGGKTGYTDDAMNTLVTAAERGGQTLIAVVLRVPGLYVSYDDTKVLLDYGFDSFKDEQIANANSADMEIVGIDDKDELAKIKEADILKPPFAMPQTVKVTMPANVAQDSLQKTMDFTVGRLVYSYEGQTLGSCDFMYTGKWEPQTEAAAETDGQSESEAAGEGETPAAANADASPKAQGAVAKALGVVEFLYGKMDDFIKQNTVVAACMGALLLLIFIPLLIVSVIRKQKYQKMMILREQEMEVRRQLEEELEKKSAAQVEAELRAYELQEKLEEERKKREQREQEVQELENAEGFYLDEEGENAEASSADDRDAEEFYLDGETEDEYTEPEDEYIEVDPEDDEKNR